MVTDDRYSRFRAVEGYSDAQEDLSDSVAAVIGLGATGSNIAQDLAHRGIKLILVDRDHLEEKDIYTSAIYTREDVEESLPKAEAARKALSEITEVETYVRELNSSNLEILSQADIILDGTDNLETRFLLSEYSQKQDVPWIYTSAIAEEGFSAFFDRKCFNCIFEEVKAGNLGTCETAGVMREISAQAALMSSLKSVKYLSGKEVEEKLDAVSGESFDLSHPGCKVCEEQEYPHLDSSDRPSPICGENRFRAGTEGSMERLKKVAEVKAENSYLVRATYDGREIVTYSSGRTVVEAEDRDHASAIYTEIMGV